MTWTYSPVLPFSVRDQIRLLIYDTDTNDQLLQDEEIDTIAALEAGDVSAPYNVFRVAAECARRVAGSFSRQGDQTDGTVRVAFSTRASDYRMLAKELYARSRRSGFAPYAGGISIADKQGVEDDSDRVRPLFDRDMLTAPGTATGAEQGESPAVVLPGVLV